MIKPVKAERGVERLISAEDCGDILYGAEYIEGLVKELPDCPILPICLYNDWNPWAILKVRFDVDSTELEKAFKYDCPWFDNHYYWFAPSHLMLRKNSVSYYKKDSTDDYAFDAEWHRRDGVKPNHVMLSTLGHGFTDGTLPYDGHGNLKSVIVGLDNGDALFGYCWFWYNK